MIKVLTATMKTMFQCDFDGTITREDISFMILDAYGDRGWRQMFEEYKAGKISVGRFNTMAFATVKADRETLLELVRERAEIRPGLDNLLACCKQRGLEFVIVSNGLDFYIEAILADIGVDGIKVFSARTRFVPDGIEACYLGPDGKLVEDSFKDVHLRLFKKQGYQVIYAGNGISDAAPARKACHVFATGDLLNQLRKRNIDCTPFEDLNDIARCLEEISCIKPAV
jgi:2-hydroxy-3-keto-5-methylthiopentenyl-1-phosphate phosphatase